MTILLQIIFAIALTVSFKGVRHENNNPPPIYRPDLYYKKINTDSVLNKVMYELTTKKEKEVIHHAQ